MSVAVCHTVGELHQLTVEVGGCRGGVPRHDLDVGVTQNTAYALYRHTLAESQSCESMSCKVESDRLRKEKQAEED